MRISVTTLGLCPTFAAVCPALAFRAVPSGVVKSLGRETSLHMSDQWSDPDDNKKAEFTLTAKQAKTIRGKPDPERRAPQMSQALPFLKCPPNLDGTLAADYGFDPLGFADSNDSLIRFREAEVKHGRLAMLAAAGWPLSELWDAKIAGLLGMEPALNTDGRVPSVLNGGMGRVSLVYWIGIVWLAAALDVYGSYFAAKKDGYTPGDFGLRFLYPEKARGQARMREAEIKHGRVAMVAIATFAALEFSSHVPVVDQFSLFFRPLNEVLSSILDSQADYGISPTDYGGPPEAVTEAVSTITSDAVAPAAMEAAASTVVEATGAVPIHAIEPTSAASTEAYTTSSMASPPAVASPPALEELDAAKNRIAQLEAQIATKEELVEARKQIAELEGKLAKIETLVR